MRPSDEFVEWRPSQESVSRVVAKWRDGKRQSAMRSKESRSSAERREEGAVSSEEGRSLVGREQRERIDAKRREAALPCEESSCAKRRQTT